MEATLRPTLESMKGDSNARCMNFFAAYAEELPDLMATSLTAIGDLLFKNHMRARLGELFLLSPGDVEATISKAAPGDNPRGWRLAIEAQAGFNFESSNVPPSAALMKVVSSIESTKLSKADKRIEKGESTISDDIMAGGDLPDDPIEEECFSGVFACDPSKEVISQGELDAFIDRVLVQFGSSHGKINLGAPLLRKVAAQAHRRIKFLPRRGAVPGRDRKFFNMIYDRANNRGHVRLSTCEPRRNVRVLRASYGTKLVLRASYRNRTERSWS